MPDLFFQTPTTFAFNHTTVFYWTDGEGTLLTGLSVIGDTDTTEDKQLPLNQTDCGRDAGGACVQFANNGTGTFGGPYADGLVLGHSYHFNIQYTEPNGTLAGSSNSSSFIMINPVVGSASKSSSASSTSATSTTASTSTAGSSTQSPSTNIAHQKHSSSGLSTGAKAGIAVGATIAGLFFLLGIFFLWRRHNRLRQTTTNSNHATGPSELEGKAMPQSSVYEGYSGGELPADAPVKKPQELDGNTIPGAAWEASKQKSQKSPAPEAARSESHLMPPASGASFASPSDASTGGSTFVRGQRTSEDMTPEQLGQLEEEERRIDEAIRESEAQKKAVEARIKQARGGAGSST